MSVGGNREKISNRWWEKGGELLFSEELCISKSKSRFVVFCAFVPNLPKRDGFRSSRLFWRLDMYSILTGPFYTKFGPGSRSSSDNRLTGMTTRVKSREMISQHVEKRDACDLIKLITKCGAEVQPEGTNVHGPPTNELYDLNLDSCSSQLCMCKGITSHHDIASYVSCCMSTILVARRGVVSMHSLPL